MIIFLGTHSSPLDHHPRTNKKKNDINNFKIFGTNHLNLRTQNGNLANQFYM